MMLFKNYHVFPMCIGVKNHTRRFWKYPRRVGSFHLCQHDFRGHSFGALEILEVYKQPLGMMTEKDAKEEGGYTLTEYKITLEMITKKPWDSSAEPYVVRFKFSPSDELMNRKSELFEEYKLMYYKHRGEVNGIQHGVKLC